MSSSFFIFHFSFVIGSFIVLQTLAPCAWAQGTRDIARFPGLARVFRDVSGGAVALSPEQEAARLFDFELVVRAVSGRAGDSTPHTIEEYRAAFAGSRPLALPVDARALGRDDTAYRLHSLGYSPKEIADILDGRISRVTLDNAQKMLMLGSGWEVVSDFLDREYRRRSEARARAEERQRQQRRPQAVPPGAPGRSTPALDAHLVRMAALHGVDAALVRAVITCESGWNPAVVSRAGAIGLMQLMPGTARELGVDPRDPQQNIEGGVRYLAGLLRLFKSVEHALIAYNAGPGFAERFARGQSALYGETREFVKNVLGRIR